MTGVTAPVATRSASTALFARIAEEDRTSDHTEVYKISEKWNSIRLLSREEADKLEPEWLEAYNRYHEKYAKDMANMEDIASKILNMIEPPKIQKKTQGQRKRDKFATKMARIEAKAAAK